MLPRRLLFPFVGLVLSALACSLTAGEPTPTVPPEEATVTVGAIVNRNSPPTRTPVGASARLPQGQPATPIAVVNEDVQRIPDPTKQARVAANLSNPECPLPDGWTTYTVNAGDSLFRIAQGYESTVEELSEANCIVDPRYIEVGQVIGVPGEGAPALASDAGEEESAVDTGGRVLEVPGTVAVYLLGETGAEGVEVGCGSVLVAVSQSVYGADTPSQQAEAALNALFQAQPDTEQRNPLADKDVQVEQVTLEGEVARVALSGEIIISGVCEIPVVRGQIEQTVLTNTSAETVIITLNGQLLDEVFSQR